MALSTDQYGYLIDPLVPITDATGKTVKDGFLRVYIAGSSTPVITYRNYDGTANEKTIELDNSGRCKYPVIVSKSLAYKVVVYDAEHSQENPIITVDKMFAIGASVTVGADATVVTGLNGFRTKPDGFVDASVIGTDGYVALDHTRVTDDLDTDAKVTDVEEDRYVPLLNEDVNDPDSKMTLGRLWQWVLGNIKSLSTTITAFRTGDVIPVDGPDGTAKMSKDDLLRETAENANSKIEYEIKAAKDIGEILDYNPVVNSSISASSLEYVDGKFVNANGVVQDNANYRISTPVRVSEGVRVEVNGYESNASFGNISVITPCTVDGSPIRVGTVGTNYVGAATADYIVPSDVEYVMVCVKSTDSSFTLLLNNGFTAPNSFIIDKLNDIVDVLEYRQAIDETKLASDLVYVSGKFVNANGVLTSNSNYKISIPIRVTEGTKVTVRGYESNASFVNISVVTPCDSEGTPIRAGIVGTDYVGTMDIDYIVPYNIDYVMVCVKTSDTSFSVDLDNGLDDPKSKILNDIKLAIGLTSNKTKTLYVNELSFTDGWVEYATGNVVASTTYGHTRGIPVNEGDILEVKYKSLSTSPNVAIICPSNASGVPDGVAKTGMKGKAGGGTRTAKYIVPSGVSYVTITMSYSLGEQVLGTISDGVNTESSKIAMLESAEIGTEGVIDIDVNTLVWNKGWINENGTYSPSSNYNYSTPLAVEKGDVVGIHYNETNASGYIRWVNAVQSDGTIITGAGSGISGMNGTDAWQRTAYIVPSGVNYVAFTKNAAVADPKIYIYRKSLVHNVTENKKMAGVVEGSKKKTAFFFGDSITAGKEIGNFAYPYWMSKMGVFDRVVNFAKGGSIALTIVDTQIPKMQADYSDVTPDYIFISVGTNDWGSSTPMGDWFDVDSTTGERTYKNGGEWNFKPNINSIVSTLRSSFPFARIIFLTPIRRAHSVRNDMYRINGKYLEDFRQAVLEIADVHGVDVFDAWSKTELNPHIDSQSILWTDPINGYDGTHPSRYGQIEFAKSLTRYIRSDFAVDETELYDAGKFEKISYV